DVVVAVEDPRDQPQPGAVDRGRAVLGEPRSDGGDHAVCDVHVDSVLEAAGFVEDVDRAQDEARSELARAHLASSPLPERSKSTATMTHGTSERFAQPCGVARWTSASPGRRVTSSSGRTRVSSPEMTAM